MRRRVRKQLKRFGACCLSFLLITLMLPQFGPDQGRTRAHELKATPSVSSGALRPDWLPHVKLPPGGVTSPARVTWDYQGRVDNGKLQINQAWVDISPLEAAGPPSIGIRSEPAGVVTAKWSPSRGWAVGAAAATQQHSIQLNLSPNQGTPGSQFTLLGQLPADVQLPMVRVLFRICDYTRGLAEIPVGSNGSFSWVGTIPEDAPPGPHDVMVAGGGGSNQVTGSASIDVLPPLPGSITGIVQIEKADNTIEPSAGGAELRVPNPSFPPGDPFFSFLATTDPQGMFQFLNLKPGEYIVTGHVLEELAGQGLVFEYKPVELKSGEHLTVNILGKILPSLKPCAAWKQMNPGEHPTMFSLIHKPGSMFDPNIGTFASMPGKGKPLINSFTAFLPFIVQGAKVQFHFVGPQYMTLDAQYVQGNLPGFHSWKVDVDMSELPAGEYQVSIEVADLENPNVKCTFEPGLSFTMINVPWFNSWITNANVQIKTNPVHYEFTGILPKPAFSFNEPIDLELITLDNIVTLGIPITETLNINGSWTGQATATAQVTVLDYDFINESQPYNPSGGQYGTRPYAFKLATIHEELGKFCVPIFAFGWGIPEILYVGIIVKFCISGFVDFDSTIKKDLKVNAIATPGMTVGLPIQAEIDILICSGDVGIEPQVTLKLPIYYDPDCSPIFGFDDPCLRMDAVFFYEVECLSFTVASGSEKVNMFKLGCGPPNTCNPGKRLMAASQNNTLPTGLVLPKFSRQGSAPSQNREAPLRPRPTVASDGAGHALAIWLEDTNPAAFSDRQFYFSYYDGTAWSAPQRLNDEPALVDRARVAFIGPNRALAVWMQNKLSFDEAHQADVPILLQNGELHYAQWDGREWSPSAPITDDDVIDARPSLAADPSTGRAMLVWMRTDQVTGFEPPLTEIYYARFQDGAWSQPALLAPRGDAIDYQPSVRFDRRGQAVALWLRDADGDLFTREDRQIMMSRFDGRAWSPPEAIPKLPAGAYTPSFDFDQNNNPIVVFVVPAIDTQTGELGTGDGNGSELYAAVRRGDTWEVGPVASEIHAERPVVKVNPDNRAITMFRQFGNTGGVHQPGDLAAAVADLNAPMLEWTTGYLTADGQTNWEVAFDIDSSTSQNFVLNVKTIPGSNETTRRKVAKALAQLPKGEKAGGDVASNRLGGTKPSHALKQGQPDIAVSSYVVPYAVDLALTPEDIAVSNTHPQVGEIVTINANIHNGGLKATSGDTPVTVRFYEGDPAAGGAQLIGEERVEDPLPFNTAASVSVPYTVSQAGFRTLTVVVDDGNAIAESDEANNTAQTTIGQTPAPLRLFTNPEPEKQVMSLGWTAPDTQGIDYYEVFRSTTPGGDYEFVGDTTMTDFVDTLVQPGVTYYYVVVAVDVYGTQSAFSNEASGQLE